MIKLKMTTTAIVTTTLVILLGVYDLIVVVFTPESESISVSAFLVNVGFTSPMVVFAVGFTCGHIFGYMKPVKPD